MRWFTRFLLYTDTALWFGASIYFSLFATLQLFHGLLPDTAAKAIGLLFPSFFNLSFVVAIIAWVLYFIYLRLHTKPPLARTGHFIIGSATIIAIINRFYFLPSIVHLEKLMGPISHASQTNLTQFGIIHGISLLLELVEIVLVLIVWLILSRQSIENTRE